MHTDQETALAMLGLALLTDYLVGEYPAAIHPVVWMGKSISACLRLAPGSGRRRQFLFGAILTLSVVSVSIGLTWFLLWLAGWHPLLYVLVGGYFLKASFALRALGRAALDVVKPLEEGDLPAARQALRSLCSRDPSELNETDLLAATIESLAENASDSFVAPLFFYMLLGVPGAVGYRAINTLDAMIGYRGKYEWLGKFAARLDDVANFIPARLTAMLFLGVGWLWGGKVGRGWRILWRDAAKTPSPNGGWPIAAMAGLLDVRLDKQGVYALGDPHEALTPAKVRQAWRIVNGAAVVMMFLCAYCIGVMALVMSLPPVP